MSQALYERFLLFLIKCLFLTVSIAVVGLFAILYVLVPNVYFFFGFCVSLYWISIFSLYFYMNYQDFQDDFHLLIPNSQQQKQEPLTVDVGEDLALRAALYYEQGSTYMGIANNLGLKYEEAARRAVKRGLRILLLEHEQHKQECVKT